MDDDAPGSEAVPPVDPGPAAPTLATDAATESRSTTPGSDSLPAGPTTTTQANPAQLGPAPDADSAVGASRRSDLQRYADLGLGCGVDATELHLWESRKAPVRQVCDGNVAVVTTDGSGSVKAYECEALSANFQRNELMKTLSTQQLAFSVGLDAEMVREPDKSTRITGKKVVNCTVSFRSGHVDPPAPASVSGSDTETGVNFEQLLSQCLMECVVHRQRKEALTLETRGGPERSISVEVTSNPVDDLAKFLQSATAEEEKELVQEVSSFIEQFRVTHYVSSLQLGAAEFSSTGESEGQSGLKTIGSIGVERGSGKDAVIGISIEPIIQLVKTPFLERALEQALTSYMEQRGGRDQHTPSLIFVM